MKRELQKKFVPEKQRVIEVEKFIEVEKIVDGEKIAYNLIPYRKGDKWGYCDKFKNIIIIAKYNNASLFHEGLARIELGKKWGYIDKNGFILTKKE